MAVGLSTLPPYTRPRIKKGTTDENQLQTNGQKRTPEDW